MPSTMLAAQHAQQDSEALAPATGHRCSAPATHPPQHAKHLGKVGPLPVKTVFARAHDAALKLLGLSDSQLAAQAETQRQHVHGWGDPEDDRLPNLGHLVGTPDEHVDSLIGALFAIRAQLGFARRAVTPAPKVIDEPEGERAARITKESADVLVLITKHIASGDRDLAEAEIELVESLELAENVLEHIAKLQRDIARMRAAMVTED